MTVRVGHNINLLLRVYHRICYSTGLSTPESCSQRRWEPGRGARRRRRLGTRRLVPSLRCARRQKALRGLSVHPSAGPAGAVFSGQQQRVKHGEQRWRLGRCGAGKLAQIALLSQRFAAGKVVLACNSLAACSSQSQRIYVTTCDKDHCGRTTPNARGQTPGVITHYCIGER